MKHKSPPSATDYRKARAIRLLVGAMRRRSSPKCGCLGEVKKNLRLAREIVSAYDHGEARQYASLRGMRTTRRGTGCLAPTLPRVAALRTTVLRRAAPGII